jgi:hypothetical protein
MASIKRRIPIPVSSVKATPQNHDTARRNQLVQKGFIRQFSHGRAFPGRNERGRIIHGHTGPALIFGNQMDQTGCGPSLQIGISRGGRMIQHVAHGLLQIQQFHTAIIVLVGIVLTMAEGIAEGLASPLLSSIFKYQRNKSIPSG